jgi:hypothetical protein
MTETSHGFLRPSWQMPRWHLKLANDHFSFRFLGWSGTESTITEANTGLLYQPRVRMDGWLDGWMMMMKIMMMMMSVEQSVECLAG